jgi:hypothetical protein
VSQDPRPPLRLLGRRSECEALDRLLAVFTVGYLAFSVPALIAGVATARFGLHSTALVYSASLAALVTVAAGILLFRPSGKPARPVPASPAVMPPVPCTSHARRPWTRQPATRRRPPSPPVSVGLGGQYRRLSSVNLSG